MQLIGFHHTYTLYSIVIYMYLAWVAWRFWLGTQSDKDDLSGG